MNLELARFRSLTGRAHAACLPWLGRGPFGSASREGIDDQ